MERKLYEIGVGLTTELSLRLSVASLVSVLFKSPADGKTMLALERNATLQTTDEITGVVVKVKPFGGGVRLLAPTGLKKLIGEYRFDSERSREQQDFRILINPKSLEKLKEICKEQLKVKENRIFDPGPERELAEEFEDSLGVGILPEEYFLQPKGMLTEKLLSETSNENSRGLRTARIYYVYDAFIQDQEIIKTLIDNSNRYSDIDLQNMANEDARRGGKGRANAILTLDLNKLKNFYNSIRLEKRTGLINYGGHQLSTNLPAILDDIYKIKYTSY
ncbi:MAG: hypothetical protein P8X73_13660 [Ignavibacteriaceae bacterium]